MLILFCGFTVGLSRPLDFYGVLCICFIFHHKLNEWKNNVKNRGMRVNMIKTKVMISGERQKPVWKALRWPCGVCGRGVGSNLIQCTRG